MGITNMAATIPGFLVPAVVGALTHGKVTLCFSKSEFIIHKNEYAFEFHKVKVPWDSWISVFRYFRKALLLGILHSI